MINIVQISERLLTANAVTVEVQPFKTNPETVTTIVNFYNNGTKQVNFDGTPYGVVILIPADVVAQWENDDTVIEDYVIQQLNLTRD